MSEGDPLREAQMILSEAADTLTGDAAACLQNAAAYLDTRVKSHVQAGRSLYLGLSGDLRKRTQNVLVKAADQASPLSEPFNPNTAVIRADLLSIGNIWGAYNPYDNLATALNSGDVPNALYTREEILLATLHHGFQWKELASMVRVLLDAGADPNCQEEDDPHWTPSS